MEKIIKIIIIVAKKVPTNVIDYYEIKTSSKQILPSYNEYNFEDKRNIFILFREMINEGIIKKGEKGSELIEEILFIGELMIKKKDIIKIKKEYVDTVNNYTVIAKKKGFKEVYKSDKVKLLANFLFYEWVELCEVEVCIIILFCSIL